MQDTRCAQLPRAGARVLPASKGTAASAVPLSHTAVLSSLPEGSYESLLVGNSS